MILHALIHDEVRYADTWPAILALIDEATNGLQAESQDPYYHPGEDAKFMFSDVRHRCDQTDWPNNCLQIAVNTSTGYGALIWHVMEGFAEKGGIYDHIWISDNPNPPDFDPRVVSDPGEPRFHHPRSTLPIPMIRQAVEEFCRVGTGHRPECIGWVRGWVNGHRLDE